MTLVLRYIARSDRGLVRSNNEDSVYAGARLLALADGMGGHAAGEVASQLVIQALRGLDDDEPGGDLLSALERATLAGNTAIAEEVQRNPELDGMGTTLTAILFAGSRIGLCHVGDSRGYLYRDGSLSQITRDDTFVQTLVDEGRITPEQAHSHPQRSLIMRALTGQDVEPTLTMREARAGDRYLLCSDGLSDVVSEETLADTLGSISDHRECADRLIELALRSGGPDNVTVVVADVVDTEFGDSRPIIGGAAGGDADTGYVPDPKTAAGRAAALRPPAEPPQRPSSVTEAPAAKKPSRWRWPIVAIVVLVVLAALVTAGLITRAKIMSNYYVTLDGNSVVIDRGSPDKVLFFSVSEAHTKVCVDDFESETPKIEFADVDSNQQCDLLLTSYLNESSAESVASNSIKGLSLDEAKNRVTAELEWRPLCVTTVDVPTPTPPQTNGRTPLPRPSGSEPVPPATPDQQTSNSPTTTTSAPRPVDKQEKPCRKK